MARMLTERYEGRLHGVLSCYDRIVITGTLPGMCYAAGMTSFLNADGIRIFDYARFAEPLRDRIRERAQQLAAEQGARIEHVAKAHIRKEDVVAKVLAARGEHPGWCTLSRRWRPARAYKPWHDKASGKTFLKTRLGQVPALLLLLHRSRRWGCVTCGCRPGVRFGCSSTATAIRWLARKLAAAGIDFTARRQRVRACR